MNKRRKLTDEEHKEWIEAIKAELKDKGSIERLLRFKLLMELIESADSAIIEKEKKSRKSKVERDLEDLF